MLGFLGVLVGVGWLGCVSCVVLWLFLLFWVFASIDPKRIISFLCLLGFYFECVANMMGVGRVVWRGWCALCLMFYIFGAACNLALCIFILIGGLCSGLRLCFVGSGILGILFQSLSVFVVFVQEGCPKVIPLNRGGRTCFMGCCGGGIFDDVLLWVNRCLFWIQGALWW